MKIEDVKIGMKVVPFQKTNRVVRDWDFNGWLNIQGGRKILDKQGYVTVYENYSNDDIYFKETGGVFHASDFEPYIEPKKQNPPYSHIQARLKAYCKLNGVDADKVFDLLFKKPCDNIREETIKLINSSDSIIPAIQYYRERTNCSLLEAKIYVKALQVEIQPQPVEADKPVQFKVGEWVNINPNFKGNTHGISNNYILECSKTPQKIEDIDVMGSTTVVRLVGKHYVWIIDMLEKISQPPKEMIINGVKYVEVK